MQYKQKMYGLVPYNISPEQKGIQFGHALQEYNNEYFARCDKFAQWRTKDKTFIILNGGTTNKQPDIVTGEPFGTLNQHLLELIRMRIPTATFMEPDLGDQLTAVVFLVDERVWDRKKYPDFRDVLIEKYGTIDFKEYIRLYCKSHSHENPDIKKVFPYEYVEWCKTIGSPQNVFLKEFLPQFKLA
jgi:hypothetical protein